MFKRENVINSSNLTGDCQFLRLLEDGFATATTLDRTVYPPLLECWYSQQGVRGDIIQWFPMRCGTGGDSGCCPRFEGRDGIQVTTQGDLVTISLTTHSVSIPFSVSQWLPDQEEYYIDFTHSLGRIPLFRLFTSDGIPVTESRHVSTDSQIRVYVNKVPDSRFNGYILMT